MPSASLSSQQAQHQDVLTPSRIAAQAAVQHLNIGVAQHVRRRSSTVPIQELEDKNSRRNSYGSVSSDGQSLSPGVDAQPPQYKNGLVGDKAATTAAQAVWHIPVEEKQQQQPEKKGLRSRFRPKHIGIIRDKDKEGKDKPMPSPNKLPTSGLAKVYNASSTSLADTLGSGNSSLYSLPNNSVSTIIPLRGDDEKKKHLGLRQKLKLKDKDDVHNLPLSSANSNSRPVDINNPQSLYSFAPSSPSHGTFSKSVSGLNLTHGARALRKEKKEKEEKAAQHAALEQAYSRDNDTSEWPSMTSLTGSLSNTSEPAITPYSKEMQNTLAVFGLNNMTADDAWEFLKARLLVIFEGEHVQIAVEDLNRLVTIHVQRCVLKRDPSIVIGDLENLLHTGFLSLNHTLRGVYDERLVPNLVDMWMTVFGTILPFMQAVFLPLDQEFKGRGTVLKTPQLAAEFWGALPSPDPVGRLSSSPSSLIDNEVNTVVAAGEELEVRRILLMSFRDHVILPRFDILKATFSRLSLESINATLAHFEAGGGRSRGDSLGRDSLDRPTTSTSDPRISSSYSSQTSTLLGGATPSHGRSRAASNLSAGSAQDVAFQSFSSPPAARPTDTSSHQVTETVGRMLQCLSVLCSVQSGDEAQSKMEELTKELKLNWLGRGRTGRNRKGFVGTRVRRTGPDREAERRSIASTIRAGGALAEAFRERDGSPTPTPTRQGTVVSRPGTGTGTPRDQ